VCPLIGLVAALATHGNGGLWTFILRFCVLPAALVVIAGALNRRRAALVVGMALLAGGMGLVAWFLVVLVLAANGVYDT
jgi:hypothetical protein